ncbi:MAG: alpha/beta hydrolase [Leptolyngbya sp. SIOISBB]|nr:alpha/beta hydrolase [Leptolyngbya sp. SIOISBB]
MRSPSVSQKFTRRLLQTTAISLLSGIVATLPARSADKIYFDYGPFSRTLPVSSLETFAEEGIVDDDLAPFFKAIPIERQQQFQQTLTTPITELNSNIPAEFTDPFVLSQWLYTPIGETVLVRSGELIQTAGRQNGRQAIRAAIILAAAEPDGLSLMNLIHAYPTDGMRLNLPNVLKLINAININRDITEALITAAAQSSEANAANEPALDYGALPVLAETGTLTVEQRSLMLTDPERDRTFPVDLFFPANLEAMPGSVPVMIFSHGYGDTRKNPQATVAARDMAANGYMVVLPEHVGSNQQYQTDLESGLNQASFEAMEFINRPLDIRFLLDTLEQQNARDFQGRLQLARVGVVGHSFGGYTTLVAAGATVDMQHLEAQCALENDITHDQVNIALALQCRALELKASPNALQQLTDGSLADDRIGLAFTISPVSSLFGETGMRNIQVPTVIMGGALDIASPVAVEQVATFRGLNTAQKYLYLAEQLSHTPELTRVTLEVTNPNTEVLQGFNENQDLFTDLVITLAIAHGNVYLQEYESYLPYLTSAYVETVSVEPLKLHLVRSVPED